jgi:hypothetical protein
MNRFMRVPRRTASSIGLWLMMFGAAAGQAVTLDPAPSDAVNLAGLGLQRYEDNSAADCGAPITAFLAEFGPNADDMTHHGFLPSGLWRQTTTILTPQRTGGGLTGAGSSTGTWGTNFHSTYEGGVTTLAWAGPEIVTTDWTPTTAVTTTTYRLATEAVGGFTDGQAIRSLSNRTTGSTFNAAEAANWVPADMMIHYRGHEFELSGICLKGFNGNLAEESASTSDDWVHTAVFVEPLQSGAGFGPGGPKGRSLQIMQAKNGLVFGVPGVLAGEQAEECQYGEYMGHRLVNQITVNNYQSVNHHFDFLKSVDVETVLNLEAGGTFDIDLAYIGDGSSNQHTVFCRTGSGVSLNHNTVNVKTLRIDGSAITTRVYVQGAALTNTDFLLTIGQLGATDFWDPDRASTVGVTECALELKSGSRIAIQSGMNIPQHFVKRTDTGGTTPVVWLCNATLQDGVNAESLVPADSTGNLIVYLWGVTARDGSGIPIYARQEWSGGTMVSHKLLSATDIDTSEELADILSDENGTGAVLFNGADSPRFVNEIEMEDPVDSSVGRIVYSAGEYSFRGPTYEFNDILARHGTFVGDSGNPTISASSSLTGVYDWSIVDLIASWDTTGAPTAIKLDVIDGASDAASLLLDLRVNSASKFKVSKTGAVTGILSGGTGLPLSTGVTGDLPFSNLTQGSARSVLGVTGNATADVAPISSGGDGQVLRQSSGALGFGALDLANASAVTGTLPVTKGGTGVSTLTSGTLLTGNGTGAITSITPGAGVATALAANANANGGFVTTAGSTTAGQVLRVTGSNAYGWGAVNLASSAAVTGTLSAANGGSGASSLNGILVGNGASAFSTITPGAGVAAALAANANGAGGFVTEAPSVIWGEVCAFNPAGNKTYIGGRSAGAGLADAALFPESTVRAIVMPRSGRIRAARIFIESFGALGTGETFTISLRKNGSSDTTLTSSATTNTAGGATFSNSNMNIAVSAGDTIALKWATPAWATPPTNIYATWSMEFVPE